MKILLLLLRCGYVAVIVALVYILINGMGSSRQDFSDIESSITKIIAGQSVEQAKRLQVVNYLDRHLTDERLGVDKINKGNILKKIREADELNSSERKILFEWVDRHTGLTVRMPDTNVFK
jgi:carbamoylphosphate synthase small subunit